MTRISDDHLRKLRNEVPIRVIIDALDLPAKEVEGFYRFRCPHCGEFNTATNPRTNLGRCFRCAENFNPIDLVMTVRNVSFLEAVRYVSARLP